MIIKQICMFFEESNDDSPKPSQNWWEKHPKLFKQKTSYFPFPTPHGHQQLRGACPMAMACAATVIAFIPEAQPIATPKHSTVLGIFASNAACRTVLEPQPGKNSNGI